MSVTCAISIVSHSALLVHGATVACTQSVAPVQAVQSAVATLETGGGGQLHVR